MFNKLIFFFSLLLVLFCNLIFAFDSYNVDFEGVQNEETLTVLKSVSKLIRLKEIPPTSEKSLLRRAESDIPNLKKALHSLSFYSSHVDLKIDFERKPVQIVFKIEEGSPYFFSQFKLLLSNNQESSFPLENISLKDLHITLGQRALPEEIIRAEERLLTLLEKGGYPLSSIEKREVVVDEETFSSAVTLTIQTGPLCYFGEVIIEGNRLVSQNFIEKKLKWKKGQIFDPAKLEETQNALEQTALFRSVSIEYRKEENLYLPIQINLEEAKQRSLGAGVSYATERGIGSAFYWEHRNFSHMGQLLSFKTNIWTIRQEATLLYFIPDFRIEGRDLRLIADYEHERTRGYSKIDYSLSAIVERQINEQIRVSYGLMAKHLQDSRSDNNRVFDLLKTPLQFRFNNTDSLLDQTEGFSFNLKIIPSLQLFKPEFFYTINTLVGSFYQPLTPNKRVIFAHKMTFGTILGATHHAIPPSERFYAGSDNLLRGYHYLTVSPLNRHRRPTGGRSMFIHSSELRMRVTETVGLVSFYEIGNVFESPVPHLNEKMVQSAGVGVRYYTPVGPLRADLAFPLNRRKKIDSPFIFYISIGQAF